MLSRLFATRQVFHQLKNVPKLPVSLQIRNHGAMAYRKGVPPNKRQLIFSEAVLGIMWWWILWHMWTEHELVTGEWPQIDPSKWSDEDLGVPPDDVGPAPRVHNEVKENHLIMSF